MVSADTHVHFLSGSNREISKRIKTQNPEDTQLPESSNICQSFRKKSNMVSADTHVHFLSGSNREISKRIKTQNPEDKSSKSPVFQI